MATKGNPQRPKSRIKATHTLASPYPEPSWPPISPEDQHAILNLLCLLLKDVGDYRKSLPRSNGKRQKRKKQEAADDPLDEKLEVPSPPEIVSSVLIGFNDVQRRLESMIRRPAELKDTASGEDRILPKQTSDSILEDLVDSADAKDTAISKELKNAQDNNLVAVFVDRSSQPPIMTRQLPDTMAAAVASVSGDSTLWLVALPNGAGTRLAEAAGVPRIGFCGVLSDAPGSSTLLHYLRSHIQPVQAMVTNAAALAQFLSLKVDTQLVEVEVKPPGKKPRNQSSPSKDDSEPRRSKKRRRKRLVAKQQVSQPVPAT